MPQAQERLRLDDGAEVLGHEIAADLARIAQVALSMGGPQKLPADMVAALVAKRTKAGLAAPEEGRGPSGTPRLERLEDQAVQRVISSLPQADTKQVRRLTQEIAEALSP